MTSKENIKDQQQLKDIFSDFQKLTIQQENGKLFTICGNQEIFNITKFKQELVNVLKNIMYNQKIINSQIQQQYQQDKTFDSDEALFERISLDTTQDSSQENISVLLDLLMQPKNFTIQIGNLFKINFNKDEEQGNYEQSSEIEKCQKSQKQKKVQNTQIDQIKVEFDIVLESYPDTIEQIPLQELKFF